MVPLMIHAGNNASDHCRKYKKKNVFFLQLRVTYFSAMSLPSYLHKSAKVALYCLDLLF